VSEFRLSPEAEAELDGIWIHIARQSGNTDIATRVVENITERFWLLARHPHMGRHRNDDLRLGLRSFPADDYVIIHSVVEDDVVPILPVVRARRDIAAFVRAIAELEPRRCAAIAQTGRLVAKHAEIESGREFSNRPELRAAIEKRRKRRAVLLIVHSAKHFRSMESYPIRRSIRNSEVL